MYEKSKSELELKEKTKGGIDKMKVFMVHSEFYEKYIEM